MSIILEEKISLLYDFINNDNKSNFNIKTIDINKVKSDDIQISKGKMSHHLLNELIKSKLQLFYSNKNTIYFKKIDDMYTALIKITLKNNKEENDNLISYILSELYLKNKTKHILLPILNFEIKLDNIKDILNGINNKITNKLEQNKNCFIKIRENFYNNIITLKNYIINNNDFLIIKIILFQIIHTLFIIQQKFPQFLHNKLNCNNIFIGITNNHENKINEYLVNNKIFYIPNTEFEIKITNFEYATINNDNDNESSTTDININNESGEIVTNIDEYKINKPEKNHFYDLFILFNDLKKIINLNSEINIFIDNIRYMDNIESVLNDKLFNEFNKNDKIIKKNNLLGSRKINRKEITNENNKIDKKNIINKRIIKNNLINSKLSENSKKYLGNQKNLTRYIDNQEGGYDKTIKPPFKTERNTPFVSNDEKNVYNKKKIENPPNTQPIILEQTIYDTSKPAQTKPQYPPAFIPIYDNQGEVSNVLPYSSIKNPAYSGPIQKIYNISLANPLTNHTTINRVFEDVLPGDPFNLNFNSTYERIQLSEFIKTNIYSQTGGAETLLSYLKLIDLNPYTLNKNPYQDLADNFMLYRAAYPIRFNEQKNNIEIAKNALGLNIRLYNMSLGEINADKINEKIDKEKFNLWREIKYYNHVREEIIKKKKSPNFISLVFDKIDTNKNIDWTEFNDIKNNGIIKQNKSINDYHDLTEIKKFSFLNKKIINIYCFSSLNDKFILEWKQLISDSLLSNINFLLIDINDSIKMAEYNIKNTNGPLIIFEVDNIKQKYKDSMDCETIKKYILQVLHENKLDLTLSSNNTLILVTEAPNNNIITWMSPVYESHGTISRMISTGYHSIKVWEIILFQIVYIYAILQKEELFFENITLAHNFYIKDLYMEQSNISYWIYEINNYNYYIPNYGYLVLFDSKYSDIDDKYKLSSTKLFEENNYSNDEIYTNIFYQFKEIMDPINFTNKLKIMGGLEPPNEILDIIRQIYNDTDLDIKNYFKKYFKFFLHNKIGSLLTKTEKEIINILNRPVLNNGNLIIYQERYDEYRWVLYDGSDSSNSLIHNILNKDDTNKIIIQNTRAFNLVGYPEINKIFPENKDNVNYDEKNLIEKYIL
jgi:hypothetical protein